MAKLLYTGKHDNNGPLFDPKPEPIDLEKFKLKEPLPEPPMPRPPKPTYKYCQKHFSVFLTDDDVAAVRAFVDAKMKNVAARGARTTYEHKNRTKLAIALAGHGAEAALSKFLCGDLSRWNNDPDAKAMTKPDVFPDHEVRSVPVWDYQLTLYRKDMAYKHRRMWLVYQRATPASDRAGIYDRQFTVIGWQYIYKAHLISDHKRRFWFTPDGIAGGAFCLHLHQLEWPDEL